MQRIRTVSWARRNIGGDRARAKLYYVTGTTWTIPNGSNNFDIRLPFNLGARPSDYANPVNSINSVFGDAPGLSLLAQQYNFYRIRGIKVTATAYYIPTATSPPLVLYFNAATSSFNTDNAGPNPNFPASSISVLPEQRWAKHRIISNQGNGAAPTSLSVYYSVNKVFGPDAIVKNDADFTGEFQGSYPWWSTSSQYIASPAGRPISGSAPMYGPYMQMGVFTMNNVNVAGDTNVSVRLKATVYTECFGKKTIIQ